MASASDAAITASAWRRLTPAPRSTPDHLFGRVVGGVDGDAAWGVVERDGKRACRQRWQVEQSVMRRWLSRCAARASAVGLRGRRQRRVHRELLRRRAQVRRGVAMAVEAPLHLQRLRAPLERHLVDAPVALDAGHALGDVHAVVEVDEVGQHVHALPGDRLVARRALVQLREQRLVAVELRVAAEAHARSTAGRHGRRSRPWCGSSGSRCRRRRRGACG